MSETLLAIRTQIITEIGGRTDVNTVINDQINYAIQELATMYEFPELQTSATCSTQAGQYQYLLPSDYYGLIGVYDETNDVELTHDNKWSFEMLDESETDTNGPRSYATFNKRLYVWNAVPADSSITLRIDYWAKHGELSSDTDAVTLPREWYRGIRLKASSFVFQILDMDEKAAARQAEFDRWLSRIKLPRSKENESARASQMVWYKG